MLERLIEQLEELKTNKIKMENELQEMAQYINFNNAMIQKIVEYNAIQEQIKLLKFNIDVCKNQ